ncbi:MAG TPA: DUF1080 domain-containing protein [Lacunisphaera sp.]|nr:DUF1080 domain-containing protein [Lacunisphaera sp.]
MKYPLWPLLVLAGAVLSAQEFSPEPGFKALFNGRDLTGWHHKDGPPLDGLADAGDGRYTVVDGAITGNADKATHGRVLLWTTQDHTGNFVLRFEFRAAPKTDGGFFFNKTQLQCGDYGSYAYKECKAYKAGDWNAIEVTVQDGIARCTCNGEVLETALKITEPGALAIEADRGAIAYRRLRIKPLP